MGYHYKLSSFFPYFLGSGYQYKNHMDYQSYKFFLASGYHYIIILNREAIWILNLFPLYVLV